MQLGSNKKLKKDAQIRTTVNKDTVLKLKTALKKELSDKNRTDLALAVSNIESLMQIQEDYIERLEKELLNLKGKGGKSIEFTV